AHPLLQFDMSYPSLSPGRWTDNRRANAGTVARCPTHWQKVESMDVPHHIAAHLARNLISLRHARTLTQDALAKAAGVPRSTIANLESGEGNPSLAVLVKVANSLGVPIDELLASPRPKVRKWAAGDIALQIHGRGVAIRPLV